MSERVLEAIADIEGSDPIEFDRPLYDVIDPDALDTLLETCETDIEVKFTYLDYEITVTDAGKIHLDPPGG